jgi:hypothetical protein
MTTVRAEPPFRVRVSGARGPAGPVGPTINAQASEAIGAHKFVNLYNSAGNLRVRLADASNPAKFANGFAKTGISNGGTGAITGVGLNEDTSVADNASVVWLSTTVPGTYQTTAPSASGHIAQPLGPAIAGVGIMFAPQATVEL